MAQPIARISSGWRDGRGSCRRLGGRHLRLRGSRRGSTRGTAPGSSPGGARSTSDPSPGTARPVRKTLDWVFKSVCPYHIGTLLRCVCEH